MALVLSADIGWVQVDIDSETRQQIIVMYLKVLNYGAFSTRFNSHLGIVISLASKNWSLSTSIVIPWREGH